MSSLLNELTASAKQNNEETVRHNLKAIIPQAKNIELTVLDNLEPLFDFTSNETLTLTAEAVAEFAKSETNRKILTTRRVARFLLNLLDAEDDVLVVQVCRALGNICFENENARELIGKDGLRTLMAVIGGNQTTNDAKLQTMACGFLLNLLMGNDALQKFALESDILDLIEASLRARLDDFEANEDCCTHVLLTLNMLSDNTIDARLSEGLCCALVDVLKISKNPEISILCLEVIHGQSENSEVKSFLAKKGMCELVFELVEKYKGCVDDEDSRAVLKMACDIIVLILTGDEPMDLLYDDGNGAVFKNMTSWLHSDDFDLLSTGILALGNFARNDAHCVQMVQNGIAKKLLDLLSKHNTVENNIKVQHAILSALRNLVILPQNKGQILDEGLVSILYPMLNINHSHVTFKLLGTLRIVIDGQEQAALDLITKKELLEKIVEWSFNSDHLGVRGEASRLLAWLIKHCRSTKPHPVVCATKDCVKCLVDMISSNHAVMQNEAFHALTLLCLGGQSSQLDRALVDADIGKNLNYLINKYKDKVDRETVVNLLALFEQLERSQAVIEHLRSASVGDSLVKLLDNENVSDLHGKIKETARSIDGG